MSASLCSVVLCAVRVLTGADPSDGPPCAGCDECAPRGVRASSCPPFVIDRDVSSTSPSADEADERDDRNDGFSSIGSAALTSSPPESTELMCAAPPEPMHIPPPRVVNARSAAQFPPHSWFWYPETAQLLPLSPLVNPLFDPDRHEVLHLPPSSYVGPYHPADKEHEHDFIRAQRCVEGCPYRVRPSPCAARVRLDADGGAGRAVGQARAHPRAHRQVRLSQDSRRAPRRRGPARASLPPSSRRHAREALQEGLAHELKFQLGQPRGLAHSFELAVSPASWHWLSHRGCRGGRCRRTASSRRLCPRLLDPGRVQATLEAVVEQPLGYHTAMKGNPIYKGGIARLHTGQTDLMVSQLSRQCVWATWPHGGTMYE